MEITARGASPNQEYARRSAKRADRFDLVVTDARGDIANQVANVEDLIAQRVDAIFLAPHEKGFEGVLQAARDAKIPVFLLDREVEGAPGQTSSRSSAQTS